MKSFSPAGMGIKAYFGLGARTFGNPGGATSGNGAFNGGGGSGPTPTMLITAGTGPGGAIGYGQTFCGVPIFGTLDAGALPPFAIAAAPFEVGDGAASAGPLGFSVDVFGVFAQNAFTSVEIIQLGLTLPTVAALFFTNGGGCGPDTVWTWALAGLVPGTQYGLVFV